MIYGAGAIGGTIAARLEASGRDVTVIARGAHREAIERDGLRLQTPDSETVHRLTTAADPSAVRDDDTVVLAMKTQDTAAALQDLAAVANPAIVCAQNGVENERLALRWFDRVYGLLVYLATQHLEPGVVQAFCAPVPGVLDIGRFPRGVDDRAQTIAADLAAAGFASRTSDRIMAFKYAKLASNARNAADVVLGPQESDGEVVARARAEAQAVYAAAGIDLASPAEMEQRTALVSPMRRVAGRRHQGSSTWQSVVRGAPATEADYLAGEVALLGRLHGVPTPVNAALQRLALRAVRERLGVAAFSPADVLTDA